MLDQILGPLCIIDFSAIELYIMEMGSQRKTMKNYWRCHCGDGGVDQKP